MKDDPKTLHTGQAAMVDDPKALQVGIVWDR